MEKGMTEHYFNPVAGRHYYRAGNDYKVSTFGKFPGYIQANIAVIPEQFCKDFREFCIMNSGPCPKLYESVEGDTSAGVLAADSNIQTDVSTYCQHHKDGKLTSVQLSDLCHQKWDSMVTFYLGCSFSFDHKLAASGITLQNNLGNVSMFQTNVPCISSGPFNCNLMVSMRSFPKESLSHVVNLSLNMDFAHGAPIHVGSPADIGVTTNNKLVDHVSGKEVVIKDNDVPCFWACGVTGNSALKSAMLPVSYSHSPGCMFVTDILSADAAKIYQSVSYSEAIVINTNAGLVDYPHLQYVSVSIATWKCLKILDDIVADDPGCRGIKYMRIQDDFSKACLDLSMRAKMVGIFLGFPVFHEGTPAEENDGVAGGIYLGRCLQAIGASVTYFIDSSATVLKDILLDAANKGFLHNTLLVIPLNSDNDINSVDLQNVTGFPIYSHFIAIERPCAAKDGIYYTMKARDISNNVGAMNKLFYRISACTKTIGIGDGGNEVGMGKVKPQVESHIPNGDKIAADITTDYLLACGVSNWGGLAIAAGLFAVRKCTVHDRYRRRGIGFYEAPSLTDFMLTPYKDLSLHEWLRDKGFRDGVLGRVELSVDGLDYLEVHAPMLKKLSNQVL